ncbi:MAG: lamin tail domain-containing protein [Candidatus Izemoplasmatales bacterium]|nr:lamin tail domain-containing protein [Candidatus Izemoplasmatales bacterium]
MKKNMIFLSYLVVFFFIVGCANDTNTTNETTSNTDISTGQTITQTVRSETTSLTTDYFQFIVNNFVINSEVSQDFYLLAELDDISVFWSTTDSTYIEISNSVVIENSSFVYPVTLKARPTYIQGDQMITVTGTFQYGDNETQRVFDIKILAIPARTYLDEDLALIQANYVVEDNFALPVLTYSAYQNITVSSELSSYLTYSNNEFIVTRPDEDITGTINFDVIYGDASEKVIVNLTLKKAMEIISGATIFISQYVEGSSYNKYIEIYNPTTENVDLSQYTLELYSNGATEASQTLTLSGTLASGQTLVLGHSSGTIYTPDITDSSVINFNGNDVIVLKQNSIIIDSIGQIGSSADFAKDVTLVRKSGIFSGNTNPNDAYTLDEWNQLLTDSAENLGEHTT